MPLQPGALLNGRYRIERVLGQGGFGAVYLATDDDLGIPCAIKENLNTSPQAERQFRREATLLATLRHPNLPRVTNHFILGGQQYLVMDFVEGDDLKTRLDQAGALPEAEALRWARQLCEALTYLHHLTPPVIHRDIKPANIKITPNGEALLVDFGIAKVAEAGQKTTTGAAALTSGYAPPEQYQLGHTDGRTDEYALAATLYHLLTGQVPPDSVERLIGQATLTPPEQLRPEMSAHVAAALRRALEIRPENRFASVADFGRALADSSFTHEASASAASAQTDALAAETQPAVAEPTRPARRAARWLIPAAAAAFVLTAGLVMVGTILPSMLATAFASATPTASATLPNTATPSATETRVPPTSTPTPSATVTDTPLPTSSPTPTFTPTLAPISAANAARLSLLYRHGAGQLLDVKWSPDAGYCAVNTTRGAYVHDGRTMALLKALEATYWMAFGPEGRALVRDAVEPKVIEWETGRVVRTLGEYDVRAAAFSPDGRTLALGGGVTPFRERIGLALMRLEDGALEILDDGRTPWGGDLRYSTDGALLMTTGPIAIWDVGTRRLLRPVTSGWALKLSPDGAQMAYQGADSIAVANTLTGAVQRQIRNDGAPFLPTGRTVTTFAPTDFHFAPDTEHLTIVYVRPTYTERGQESDLTVMRWGFKGEPPGTIYQNLADPLVRHQRWRDWYLNIYDIARPELGGLSSSSYRDGTVAGFSPDGRIYYDALGDDALRFWDVSAGEFLGLTGPYDSGRVGALSLDGARLAVPSGLGVDILDVASGQSANALSNIVNPYEIDALTFLTDTLIVQKLDKFERWDIQAHNVVQNYALGDVIGAVSADGRFLALRGKYITIYDLQSGQPRHVFGSAYSDADLKFTPDGRYLALASGQAVGLWSTETGQRERNFASHGPRVGSLAFAPDGTRLVSSSGTVWDVESGEIVARFAGSARTGPVAVSPDGGLILTSDGQLWSAETGQALGSLSSLHGAPNLIGYTADGRRIVWQCVDGVVEVWGIRP